MPNDYRIGLNLANPDGTFGANMQEIVLHTDVNAGPPKDVHGRFVTLETFISLFTNFLKGSPMAPFACIRFNRQILQLMLAIQDCDSIIFCRSLRGADETITAVAVKNDRTPLGWDSATPANSKKELFVSAEWGNVLSSQQAIALLGLDIKNVDPENLDDVFHKTDFTNLFTNIK